MKHEWRKKEKNIYLPSKKPEYIELEPLSYFVVAGKGNPNNSNFSKYIEALYAASYVVRMSYKKDYKPDGYYEYTVYPLEGVWDISDEAKKRKDADFNKDNLVFELMIRQPSFVDQDFATKILDLAFKKTGNELIQSVELKQINEGKCVQMMHHGSYDDEAKSFAIMEDFCNESRLERVSKKHREIYISDPRKVAVEKLKTVLRFQVR